MTEVVAALIWEDDRFLICQRPAHKTRGLLWEFVGGKVESCESKKDALVRECREELAIEISIGDVFVELDHVYPDLTIHLTLYNATIHTGTPRKLEHNDLRWILPEEIPQYDFCPADSEILKIIQLRKRLILMQDPKFKDFQCRLIPTKETDSILGIRMPELRKLAKIINDDCSFLIDYLPHKYLEEDFLHGILISNSGNYAETVNRLDTFLPYVDNWATCDLIVPKSFYPHLDMLLKKIPQWLESKHPYTVRFGIGVLMRYYLDDAFDPAILELIAGIRREAYYVNMMRAWFFATALAKQYPATIIYLQQHKLDIWTHNKTIQKAIESLRIPKDQKDYLRKLKR